MHHITPRQVRTWSVRVFAVSAPVTLGVMVAWAVEWLPPERPIMALMLFLLALATTAASAVTASAAACHLAVGRAFSAGMRAGERYVDDGGGRHRLRLVE